jgi:prepilin-type N-terminal cleavage/methylation domain-containing protein/prepilin-type processing-associated H-X9-DG protein
MRRVRAYTLIELLVVIAIIAILAAILFPVFARAKEAAKKAASVLQMRQLAACVMMYAGDWDDYFPPASMRTTNPADTPTIWTELVQPYVKNKEIFVAPGSNAGYAENWGQRRVQSVGYSDATGVDPNSTAVPGNAPPGTEGFLRAVSFNAVSDSVKTGLFAVTPNGPPGDTTTKHRGYVFNPYNGLNSPDGDYKKGLPMISDRDLVDESGDPNYPTSPTFAPGQLKPIYCRYMADKRNNGTTPVVFADGHVRAYSARALNSFGTVIWRFR